MGQPSERRCGTGWASLPRPTNVEVVSGHPLLKSAAVENVKTWHFENPYAVERRYETTFEYRLLNARRVTFESFGHVEVVIDPVETINILTRQLLKNRHFTH
jgi:hypothetical protein